MKERLDQLTLAEFIELSCGDAKVLLEKHEVGNDEKLLKVASNLMGEYKGIASPTKAKMDLIDAEDGAKLVMKEKCARILVMLCTQGHHEMTIEVLQELDIDTSSLNTNEKIEVRCKALLDEAMFDLKRFEESQKDKDDKGKKKDVNSIRKAWNSEIAYVMSTLRMPIDIHNTSAAIYANLVRQAGERAKALAKIPAMMQF